MASLHGRRDKKISSRRGQSIMETAILFLVIVFAFIAMQTYMKRGLQGRLRRDIDSIGEPYDFNTTSSDFTVNHLSNTVTTTSTVTQNIGGENRLVTTVVSQTLYDNTTRAGYETVAP